MKGVLILSIWKSIRKNQRSITYDGYTNRYDNGVGYNSSNSYKWGLMGYILIGLFLFVVVVLIASYYYIPADLYNYTEGE